MLTGTCDKPASSYLIALHIQSSDREFTAHSLPWTHVLRTAPVLKHLVSAIL